MKKTIIFVFYLGIITLANPVHSQQYIADYSVAKEDVLRSIPEEYINKARTEYVVAFQHTSHGTHVAYGVFGLPDYKAGDQSLFGVTRTADGENLHFLDYALDSYAPVGIDAADLSRDETAFIQTTRNYLDAPENATVNVVMWSWCDIAWHEVELNYLPGMDSLMAEYGSGGTMIGSGDGQRELPVLFIFMTGHANDEDNIGHRKPRDQAALITDYCKANGYYCLDYYSIDSHDMDDNYWEDVGDDGNSPAYGGNFYVDWQNSHNLGTDYYENREGPGGTASVGAHNTQHITANRKAYAFWWILARAAGWDGDTATHLVEEIKIHPDRGITQIFTGSTLQLIAEVLPQDAINPGVKWEVQSDDGFGTITPNGLFTGVQVGGVRVIAYSIDGTEISDTLRLTIENTVVVTSIEISLEGGGSELEVGSIVKCLAKLEPDSASGQEVTWSVENLSGSATISFDGYLTALSVGMVRVIAEPCSCAGLADTLDIEITPQVSTGESGTASLKHITLYPNPGNGTFYLDVGTNYIRIIEVIDQNGRTIKQVKPSGEGDIEIDLSGFPAGFYLVRINSGRGLAYRKLIIRSIIL